nr:MAG TPA: hypothetical protein [Caudoviricetes sp.]
MFFQSTLPNRLFSFTLSYHCSNAQESNLSNPFIAC